MTTKKHISLKDKNIEYNLRESLKARCLRITVHPGGEVSATLPRGMSLEKLENFLRQKSEWILKKINIAKRRRPAIFLPKSNRKDYLKYKESARKLAVAKIEELNSHYQFPYRRISIRNQKSRWGSCSLKGNLNFNYKIIFLPEIFLDYIVVHELCHLKEFNHSKRFWKLVEQLIPDYKKVRKDFKSL